MLLLGFPAATLAATAPLALDRIGFYEGNAETPVPDWDSTRIKTTFARASSRSIFIRARLRNVPDPGSQSEVTLTVHFLRPDGEELGVDEIEVALPSDRESVELTSGWGWDGPDHWQAGFYRVEIRLAGDTLIGDGRFLVKADTRFTTRTGGVRFEQMGFYEAGDDGLDQSPDGWSDERLRARFPQSEARYIYTMIRLRNLKWNVEDQKIKLHLQYFRANGELFGDPVIDYTIPSDWETAELWNGWGWPEAGNWEPGRYRVELWLENTQKIGQSHFNID